MSGPLSDRVLLSALIVAGENVLRERSPSPHDAPDLVELALDLADALHCPNFGTRLGAAEVILATALQKIAAGGTATQAEMLRLRLIANAALEITRDHFFDACAAEARRRIDAVAS